MHSISTFLRRKKRIFTYLRERRSTSSSNLKKDPNGKYLSSSQLYAVTDGEGYRLKAPKTYAGYRKAEIPERVKIVLQRLSEERKPITELNIQTMSNKFPHELEKAGLHRFRFHDLRHYFASTLLALGVPDLYVIKIIGHSTTSMLEHYQHVLSDEDRKFRDLIRENL